MDNNYGVSGIGSISDSPNDIPQNRSLMAEQLTKEAPLKPEIVEGLQNLRQVFAHYKPEIQLSFDDAEGIPRTETIRFNNLDDFSPERIAGQSAVLTRLAAQNDACLNMISQLRNNKPLHAALADPGAKQALLDAVHGMIAELKNNP